jgi:hypothetical protein
VEDVRLCAVRLQADGKSIGISLMADDTMQWGIEETDIYEGIHTRGVLTLGRK